MEEDVSKLSDEILRARLSGIVLAARTSRDIRAGGIIRSWKIDPTGDKFTEIAYLADLPAHTYLAKYEPDNYKTYRVLFDEIRRRNIGSGQYLAQEY